MHQGEKAGMLPAKEQGGYGRRKTGMLLGNMQGCSGGEKAGMVPRKEQGDSQKGKERTSVFQEEKIGMVPGKGRKNRDALGTEGWDGPGGGTGTLRGPRALHLHPAAAQQQSTAPHCWPPAAFPSPATGLSLCLPSTDKINYQP